MSVSTVQSIRCGSVPPAHERFERQQWSGQSGF